MFQCEKIQEIILFGKNEINDDSFVEFKCKDLKLLKIDKCGITDKTLIRIANHTNLEELTLNNCPHVTEEGVIKIIENSSLLQMFQLYNRAITDKITDSTLAMLAKRSKIREIKLFGCSKITEEGLNNFKDCEELKLLVIVKCDKITDAVKERLKNIKEVFIEKNFDE